MAKKITTGNVRNNNLKGDRLRYYFTVNYVDKSGVRRKKNSPQAKTVAQAKTLCDEFVREVITPLTLQHTDVTLRTLYEQKIESMTEDIKFSSTKKLGQKISSSTLYDFKNKLRLYVFSKEKKYPFIDNPISQMTVDDISRIKNDINNYRLSERYTKNLFSLLNGLLMYTKERGYITHSFYLDCMRVTAVGKRNTNKKKDDDSFFTFDEFKLILQYVDLKYKDVLTRQFFRTFYMVLFFQANRNGENIALLWKDINFEKDTVGIHKSYNDTKIIENFNVDAGYLKKYNGLHFEINRVKTPDGDRDLYLHPYAKQELLKLKELYEKNGIYNKEDFVFLYGMRPISTKTLNYQFNRLLALIQKDHEQFSLDRTIHSLRHSGCSYYKEIGIELDELIKLLGHRNEEMIRQVYAHDYKTKESSFEKIKKANELYQL